MLVVAGGSVPISVPNFIGFEGLTFVLLSTKKLFDNYFCSEYVEYGEKIGLKNGE